MCGLGHHEHPVSIKPPRKRAKRVPALSREEIAANRAKKRAALEAEVRPPAPVEDEFHGNAQMELIPPGVEELADHMVDNRPYWARDRD